MYWTYTSEVISTRNHGVGVMLDLPKIIICPGEQLQAIKCVILIRIYSFRIF